MYTIVNINQTYIDYYQTRASNGHDERIEDNNKLFTQALLGFIVILTVTIAVITTEFLMKKDANMQKINSLESINNVCLEMVEFNASARNIVVENKHSENNQRNKYRKIAIHAILYAGLMVAFEYWFFNQIIMKYKVISNEEIEYLFAEKLSTVKS